MVTTLGEKGFSDPEKPCVQNRFVDMYHSGTDKESQHRIASDIVQINSNLRCVIATVAFGMGINLPDVDYVMHWGSSPDIMSYWQEVGRCARDGRQGNATLFVYPRSLDKRRVDNSLKQLIINVKDGRKCFRRGVLEHLVIPEMSKESFEKAMKNPRCCKTCMI